MELVRWQRIANPLKYGKLGDLLRFGCRQPLFSHVGATFKKL
jgi:hypothetical protein